MVTIFRNLYKSSDVPYLVMLEKVVERIKTGASRDLIERIRKAKNKTDADKFKKQLPCIMFAGEFRQRSKAGLKQHNGYMILDLDDVNTEEVKQSILEIPYVVMMFTSPSGNGLKFVIKIPKCSAEEHEQYFRHFEEDYHYLDIDASGKDVSRVCFESYDPDIYFNPDAEVYAPKLIDKGYSNIDKVPMLPIESEDEIINRIVNFNWKKSAVKGERNSYIFDISGAFCEYGVSEHTALNYCMQYAQDDFTAREIQNTVKSAYKTRQFKIKYFEDYERIKSIKADLGKSKADVKKKYGIDDDTYEEIKNENENAQFWTVTETKNGNKKIGLDILNFKKFLESNGYRKHYPLDVSKPKFVIVESNIVDDTSAERIKDFVLTYLLEDAQEHDVWSYFASHTSVFSDELLTMLETIELDILRDKKDTSYFAFRNGILEVKKNSVKLLDYIDINYMIWRKNIIDRDFVKTSDVKNDYQKFIENISKNKPLPLQTTIGYLLSTYKSRTENKATIFNDEVISENPEGGTGKGLVFQGIGQFRKIAIIDGKTFSDTKSFPYQIVSLDTDIILFDDVHQGFNFENKFSLITEGIQLEWKNKDAVKLDVKDSPKIAITTNYAIKGSGRSHDRRRHEIEASQYYSEGFTPKDEFGRELFDDWEEEDFNKFDNYMISCLQLYFEHGLVKQDSANMEARHFIAETSYDFYNYMENQYSGLNKRMDKKAEYSKFITAYPDYMRNGFTQNKFTIWIKKWAEMKEYHFEDILFNGMQLFEIQTEKAPF